jgi:membrane protein DedA with SNARE-associated domain/rhodanese-related sulfurtransferase
VHQLASLVAAYGLLAIFVAVFLDEAGLPIPSIVALLAAGAAYHQRPLIFSLSLATAIVASLAADLLWYWAGRRFGRRIQTLLCRISLSPDSCVRQTEDLYGRIGPSALLFVRYLPGLTNIAVAMAAISRMRFSLFLLTDMAGAALYFGVPVLLGAVFHRAIAQIVGTLLALGSLGATVVVVGLGLYVARRWWERASFIRQLRMDRISVDELIALMESDSAPVILDVRPEQGRRDGIIPGAWPAHPDDIHTRLLELGRETEIVVYCACPNEASAAMAAQHLKKAGFRRIRPLLGGVEAWLGAGRALVASA